MTDQPPRAPTTTTLRPETLLKIKTIVDGTMSEQDASKIDHAKVLQALNAHILANPNDASAILLRGRFYTMNFFDKEKVALGRQDFQRALALSPANIEIYQAAAELAKDQEDWDAELTALNNAVALAPQNVQIRVQRADRLMTHHETDKALADLTEAIRLDPNIERAYVLRSNIYNERKQDDLAIQDRTQAIRIAPNTATNFYARGANFADRTDLQSAIKDYTRAIELDPQNAFFIASRAEIYEQLGDKQKALADFKQATAIDPSDTLAHFRMGILYHLLKEPALEQAAYDRVLAIDPHHFDARVNRGIVLLDAKQFSESLNDFNAAVAVRPTDPSVYRLRSAVFEALGNETAAKADLEKFVALGGKAQDKSVLEFLRHYWAALAWIAVALSPVLGYILGLIGGNPLRSAAFQLGCTLYIGAAIYRTFRVGTKPTRVADGMVGLLIGWTIWFIISTILFLPVTLVAQAKFLFRAWTAWKRGETLIDDTGKSVRQIF